MRKHTIQPNVVVLLLGILLLLINLAPSRSAAAELPEGFKDEAIATLQVPTALAFTPDGRLLITGKFGKLWVYHEGSLLETPALDLAGKICTESERGLLGVAIDPVFASNRWIYLYYTYAKHGGCETQSPRVPVNRVSRFRLEDNNRVDTASELVLIDNILSYAGNHNGGDLKFGKDGHLYISVGDGGCDYASDSGCQHENDAARDQHVLLGKILRITREGGIPADNPYQGADSARCHQTGETEPGKRCQETYASGLRNPFRIAFDPNATETRFFINDVGDITWEEIDEGQAGADYGWNVREGHCATRSSTDCGAPPAGMTNPVFDYNHDTGCTSITGGAFVPAGLWPSDYDGDYLFGDFVCQKIFRLEAGNSGYRSTELASNLGRVVSMVFGPAGSGGALYYTTYQQNGQVRRLSYTGNGNRTPSAVARASSMVGEVPFEVTFDATGSSDPNGDALEYEWSFGDGSAPASGARVSYTFTRPGQFTVTLRVRDPDGATATATLQVVASGTLSTRAWIPLVRR